MSQYTGAWVDTIPPRGQLIDEITARIQPICAQMSASDFHVLVERMADIELRYWNVDTTTSAVYRHFRQWVNTDARSPSDE